MGEVVGYPVLVACDVGNPTHACPSDLLQLLMKAAVPNQVPDDVATPPDGSVASVTLQALPATAPG